MCEREGERERMSSDLVKKSEQEITREIGDRMLKGWTMLAEPCPISGCTSDF